MGKNISTKEVASKKRLDITGTYKHAEGELTCRRTQGESAPPNLGHHIAFAGSKKERDIFLYASARNSSKAEEEMEKGGEEVVDASHAEQLSVGFQEVHFTLSQTPTPISIWSFHIFYKSKRVVKEFSLQVLVLPRI